jgi:hypothetical protein
MRQRVRKKPMESVRGLDFTRLDDVLTVTRNLGILSSRPVLLAVAGAAPAHKTVPADKHFNNNGLSSLELNVQRVTRSCRRPSRVSYPSATPTCLRRVR